MKKQLYYQPVADDFLIASQFYIRYKVHKNLNRKSERFDFTDEWNNLGYGRITCDRSKFSISTTKTNAEEFSQVLGTIHDAQDQELAIYCGIKEDNDIATLWFNREVGPVDGLDYYIIEDFLLNYKTKIYGSEPVLSEIPFGFNSAVTMRIDCDENIASGRRLFELYQSKGVPFSLAIKTSLDFNEANTHMMLDVIAAGGSVVSHSHTHAPNWGGSREKAKWEAETARERLKSVLPTDYNYDYVVSPFHQNPQYAVQGLADAGIKGFVGGIIKNDPEYLQARAGYVSTGELIITHSQQCMLHGDCYRDTGLEVYKQSYENHYHTNTFFGFLDHPFSDYWYGWNSEEERLNAHKDFLELIQKNEKVWFANLIEAMNFLWVKANTKIWVENNQLKWKLPDFDFNIPSMKVFWKGQEYEIKTSSKA